MNELTRHDVVLLLRAECQALRSQRKWAREAGVSAMYVSDVLHERRAPGVKILSALGLRAIEHDTRYERIPTDHVEAGTTVS